MRVCGNVSPRIFFPFPFYSFLFFVSNFTGLTWLDFDLVWFLVALSQDMSSDLTFFSFSVSSVSNTFHSLCRFISLLLNVYPFSVKNNKKNQLYVKATNILTETTKKHILCPFHRTFSLYSFWEKRKKNALNERHIQYIFSGCYDRISYHHHHHPHEHDQTRNECN